eukprot:jgi/Pico_ML_1/53279/g3851.t1
METTSVAQNASLASVDASIRSLRTSVGTVRASPVVLHASKARSTDSRASCTSFSRIEASFRSSKARSFAIVSAIAPPPPRSPST